MRIVHWEGMPTWQGILKECFAVVNFHYLSWKGGYDYKRHRWLSENCSISRALSYFSDLTLSQEFQPMAAQLSMKAALPLAKILATASCRSSKTGPSALAMGILQCCTKPSIYGWHRLSFQRFTAYTSGTMMENANITDAIKYTNIKGSDRCVFSWQNRWLNWQGLGLFDHWWLNKDFVSFSLHFDKYKFNENTRGASCGNQCLILGAVCRYT